MRNSRVINVGGSGMINRGTFMGRDWGRSRVMNRGRSRVIFNKEVMRSDRKQIMIRIDKKRS